MTLTVLADPAAVARAAAERIVDAARTAISQRGAFRIALSGGSTPKSVYPLLTAPPLITAVGWERVDFFWGDERAVPPDHPESNFGVAFRMLIAHLPGVRPEQVHRMPADQPDLEAAAAAYESELRAAFGSPAGDVPRFDLVWLGMGPDGHTASLFPDSEGLAVTDRLVVANWAPSQATWRMTLTFPVLNAAREALFVVTGGDKAAAVRDVSAGGSDLPAARVSAERTEWLVDAAAAGELARR